MVRSFSFSGLSVEDIGPAFPLVNAEHPGIDATTWRSFALPLVDAPASSLQGICGMRNEAGYLCGLMVYRVASDLHHGPLLAVDLLVAVDLVNQGAAALALLHGAEEKAHELDCQALRIQVGVQRKALARTVKAAGFCAEAQSFCKRASARLLPT